MKETERTVLTPSCQGLETPETAMLTLNKKKMGTCLLKANASGKQMQLGEDEGMGRSLREK